MIPSHAAQPGGKRCLAESLLVLAVGFVLYTLLLSRHHIGDGLRWLPMFTRESPPQYADCRYYLFPYYGWVLNRMFLALGLPYVLEGLAGPELARIVFFQAVNALWGAAGMALFYAFLRACRLTRAAALVGVTVGGLSNAYLMHATDMTEVLSSVPLMLSGLLLIKSREGSSWACYGGVALIAVSACFYQAAASAILPACLISGFAARGVTERGAYHWKLMIRPVLMGASCFGVFTAVAILCRLIHPPADPAFGIWRTTIGGGMYGHLTLRNFTLGLFGFGNALAPLQDWHGGWHFWTSSRPALTFNLVVLSLAYLLVAVLISRGTWGRARLVQQRQVGVLVGALCWLLAIYVGTSYFEPTYEKLWLFGVLAVAILAALAFDASPIEGPATPRGWALRADRASKPAIVSVAIILAAASMAQGALPRRFKPNDGLEAARVLRSVVSERDLVVYPGWDPPAVYVTSGVVPLSGSFFCLVPETIAADFSAQSVARQLHERVSQTLASGGRVLVVSLLDASPDDWRPFYGEQLHLPYELFRDYRENSFVFLTLPGTRGPVVVYEYRPEKASYGNR
jgi:hypothetical protein